MNRSAFISSFTRVQAAIDALEILSPTLIN